MNTLNERQNRILRMIISDYIQSAKAIGSAKLVKRHKMACCSATVRNDMALLEEYGYLKQSHVSSGRVPTTLGFRHYIDNLMMERDIPTRFRRRITMMVKSIDSNKYSQAIRLLADELSSLTNSMTFVSYPPDRVEVSGMRYVFRHPEFTDFHLIRDFATLRDMLDRLAFDVRDKMRDDNFRVFLAEELGYEYTREVGMVIKKFRDPFGEDHVIGLVGPIRMDYNIMPTLLDFASRILEEF